MKKIKTVFNQDFNADFEKIRVRKTKPLETRWVETDTRFITPRLKMNGWAVKIEGDTMNPQLYKRVVRRLKPEHMDKRNKGILGVITETMLEPAMNGWERAQMQLDPITGDLPGWMPIEPDSFDSPDKFYWGGLRRLLSITEHGTVLDGTYELCGDTIYGNPHHVRGGFNLYPHQGYEQQVFENKRYGKPPTDYDSLKAWLATVPTRACEGIVWEHADGRRTKVKRSDFELV